MMVALVLLGAVSIGAQAAVVNVFPPNICSAATGCFTTGINGGNDTAAFSQLAGLDLLYKAESDAPISSTPKAESGAFQDSYSTEFISMANDDYTGAHISYDGGPSIDCTAPCYLLVKGGKQDPARYLFDLTISPYNWDGLMMLNLSGFWQNGVRGSDGKGSISHAALFGKLSDVPSPVPVPAAFWLFGTALVGFIGFSRRIAL